MWKDPRRKGLGEGNPRWHCFVHSFSFGSRNIMGWTVAWKREAGNGSHILEELCVQASLQMTSEHSFSETGRGIRRWCQLPPSEAVSMVVTMNLMVWGRSLSSLCNEVSRGELRCVLCTYILLKKHKDIRAAQDKREVGFCEFPVGQGKGRWIGKEQDRDSSLLCHTLKICDRPCWEIFSREPLSSGQVQTPHIIPEPAVACLCLSL